ncbi:MAG: ParB N-terminal domain-containing protein [Minisyncoccia bacterium]
MKSLVAPAPILSVHKPCVFNLAGATQQYCKEISGIPAREKSGCAKVACKSPWRVKTREEEPKSISKQAPPPTPKKYQLVPKPAPVVIETKVEVSDEKISKKDEWRGILARVKKAIANAEFISLDPKRIRPMPRQPRDFFDTGGLSMLETSIREVGQIQPGMIRRVPIDREGRDHELLDGERRYRVIMQVEGMAYRAMSMEIDDQAAPFVVAAIANFNREGHTPMEVSDAIERMHNPVNGLGMPMDEIAKLLGIALMWAYAMHSLQKLHPRVRDMLDPKIAAKKEDRLPVTAAIHISKLYIDLQFDLALRVLAKEVSLRSLRGEVLRVADASGTEVRRRAVEPRKRAESLDNMSRNLFVLAEDLCIKLRESDMGPILKNRPPESIATIRRRLSDVETRVLEAKHLIARMLE